jgi:hypothetical protein
VLAEVRFVVVGGVAVVLHGHLRATKDLDLILDLAPDEVRKAIRVSISTSSGQDQCFSRSVMSWCGWLPFGTWWR